MAAAGSGRYDVEFSEKQKKPGCWEVKSSVLQARIADSVS